MTALLQEAVARISMLPEDEQDRAAEALLAFATEKQTYVLSAEQVAGILHAINRVDAGTFASDQHVRDLFGRNL